MESKRKNLTLTEFKFVRSQGRRVDEFQEGNVPTWRHMVMFASAIFRPVFTQRLSKV